MKSIPFKCEYGHRLLDITAGSRLKIRYKCSNQRVCPDKKRCSRLSDLVCTDKPDSLSDNYRAVKCPDCGKRIFDATEDSVGLVTIKCESCAKIVVIPIIAQ